MSAGAINVGQMIGGGVLLMLSVVIESVPIAITGATFFIGAEIWAAAKRIEEAGR